MENMPRDILQSVLRAIPSLADSVRAGAVSREWYAVAVNNRPSSPRLALPSTEAAFSAEYAKISPVCWLWRPSEIQIGTPPPETSLPTFLTVFGNGDQGARIIKDGVDYPIGARFIGAFSGGWVALALDGWRGHCLLNLNSGERLPLPDLIRTPVIDVDCVVGIQALAFSAAPSTEAKYLVGAIASGASNIAFWRSGCDRWCPPTPPPGWELEQLTLSHSRAMLPRDPVADMLYSHGRFYVLYNEEQLLSYMEVRGAEDNGNEVRMIRIGYHFQSSDMPDHAVVSRYLLECRGNIFMVRQLQNPVRFEFLVLLEEGMIAQQTMQAQWRQCSLMHGSAAFFHRDSSRSIDLGGCAVFLGKSCSRSVETGMPGRVVIHPSYNNGCWFYP